MFINVAQFNFIKQQAKKITQAKNTTNDGAVLKAVQEVVIADLAQKITMTEEELTLLLPIIDLKNQQEAEQFVNTLAAYVKPFPVLTKATIKTLFKKEKKLAYPPLEQVDWQSCCFIAWDDVSTNRRYIVYEHGDLRGLRGVISKNHVKGVCSVCHQHGTVTQFTLAKKGNQVDQFTSRTNYICVDSDTCNEQISDLEHMLQFFAYIAQT